MVLDDLIEALARQVNNGAGHLPIRFDSGWVPVNLCSWRGRYDELTIDSYENASMLTVTLLEIAKGAIGATFEGYKGGDFTMTGTTPVWADEYGRYQRYIPTKIEQVGDEIVISTICIWDYT